MWRSLDVEDEPNYQVWDRAELDRLTRSVKVPASTNHGHRKLTKVDERYMARDYRSGLALHDVAMRYGRSDATVRKVLKAAGIKIRKAGGQSIGS